MGHLFDGFHYFFRRLQANLIQLLYRAQHLHIFLHQSIVALQGLHQEFLFYLRHFPVDVSYQVIWGKRFYHRQYLVVSSFFSGESAHSAFSPRRY